MKMFVNITKFINQHVKLKRMLFLFILNYKRRTAKKADVSHTKIETVIVMFILFLFAALKMTINLGYIF